MIYPIHLLVIGRSYSRPKRLMNADVISPTANLDSRPSRFLITSSTCASMSMPRSATISRWRSRNLPQLGAHDRIVDDAEEWHKDLVEPRFGQRVER